MCRGGGKISTSRKIITLNVQNVKCRTKIEQKAFWAGTLVKLFLLPVARQQDALPASYTTGVHSVNLTPGVRMTELDEFTPRPQLACAQFFAAGAGRVLE